MTEKLQRKINNSSLDISNNITLSIQFSLDGFSFCITKNDTNEIQYYFTRSFTKTLKSPEKLLEKIKIIFEEEKELQKDFKKIRVIHENHLSALVPEAYFDKNLLVDYLDISIKTLKTDFIAFDTLQKIPAKNVYVPYVNINNYLFQSFGEFEYKHHHSVLLEKILQKKINNKAMYVNVAKTHLDIIVTNNSELLLINSFAFDTKEDFIYYILFVAEQLDLDTEKFLLTFSGLISKYDDIYMITYKYVRNINFVKIKEPIDSNFNEPYQKNYILLGE
ncbi:DUF3822 family protein [Polaribacter sp.]|uniref:DUF3822 family protein n=1 Tax=Polaribacter sp. TaxID=1920175 RepID=UPI0025EDB717|nr:DUF3822 family protein [Polaribacter sp.]